MFFLFVDNQMKWGELATRYRWTGWVWEITAEVQDFRESTNQFRGIYLRIMKKNQKMSTCNQLDFETLGSQPIMSKSTRNTVCEGEKKAHGNILYLPLLTWYVTNWLSVHSHLTEDPNLTFETLSIEDYWVRELGLWVWTRLTCAP